MVAFSFRVKQVIAYEYTSNSVKGAILGDLIKDVIVELHKIGLFVINVTCDMATTNLASYK